MKPKTRRTRRTSRQPARQACASFRPARVLVPVDLREYSKTALDAALPVARRFGSPIVLLYVRPESSPLAPAASAGRIEANGPSREEADLQELARHADSGVQFSVEVRSGRPYVEIVEAADQLGCDLIVLSTHGISDPQLPDLSTTTERVVHCAHCPVLVVREEEEQQLKRRNHNHENHSDPGI